MFTTQPDITRMVHQATRRALDATHPDEVLNIESHFFDVTLEAESCEYSLDVGREVWLNKGRWSRLIREYVPLEPLRRFQAQVLEIERGEARKGATANMMFRDPVRYDKKHRWGGCLMGAVYRQGCLTFHSRTTYMGYMGLLDAGIAALIGRPIEVLFKRKVRFRWHIASMQLHCFKSLPFIFSQPYLMKQLTSWDGYEPDKEEMSPTWYHVTKWYHKVLDAFDEYGVDMLDHEKYGPFKRIKRRWLEHMGHVDRGAPPSLDINELDFAKAE